MHSVALPEDSTTLADVRKYMKEEYNVNFNPSTRSSKFHKELLSANGDGHRILYFSGETFERIKEHYEGLAERKLGARDRKIPRNENLSGTPHRPAKNSEIYGQLIPLETVKEYLRKNNAVFDIETSEWGEDILYVKGDPFVPREVYRQIRGEFQEIKVENAFRGCDLSKENMIAMKIRLRKLEGRMDGLDKENICLMRIIEDASDSPARRDLERGVFYKGDFQEIYQKHNYMSTAMKIINRSFGANYRLAQKTIRFVLGENPGENEYRMIMGLSKVLSQLGDDSLEKQQLITNFLRLSYMGEECGYFCKPLGELYENLSKKSGERETRRLIKSQVGGIVENWRETLLTELRIKAGKKAKLSDIDIGAKP
ncbi:MAG: hypothetical protein NTU57_03000 [Candidatus Aenigmarchaeota archaeon]|nr:hypothetical protein [Candidatus Aenigmarchaeota archaeon]